MFANVAFGQWKRAVVWLRINLNHSILIFFSGLSLVLNLESKKNCKLKYDATVEMNYRLSVNGIRNGWIKWNETSDEIERKTKTEKKSHSIIKEILHSIIISLKLETLSYVIIKTRLYSDDRRGSPMNARFKSVI